MVMEIIGSMVDATIVCWFYAPESLLQHPSPEGKQLGAVLRERCDHLNGTDRSAKQPMPQAPEFLGDMPPPGRWEVVVPAGSQPGDRIQVQCGDRVCTVDVPKNKNAGDSFYCGDLA